MTSLRNSGEGLVPCEWARYDAANAAMDRYADGDDDAFDDLYTELSHRLLPYLRRFASNDAQVADLLQQTMLQLHLTRGRFLRGAPVVPWALAIARRVAIDEARRTRRYVDRFAVVPDDGEYGPDRGAPADEEVHARRLALRAQHELARLPESQRTAFEMVRFDGLSMREVASRLGTTVNAVKLRAHRAYVALSVAIYRDRSKGPLWEG